MKCQNTQLYLQKAGNSNNDQTNDHVPNEKLKSLYNEVKASWMLKYGTTKFLLHHMNYILVEAWDAFKISDRKIIRYRFVKKKILPLISQNLTTNNQARDESIQVSSVTKNEEIYRISLHTVAPIKVHVVESTFFVCSNSYGLIKA